MNTPERAFDDALAAIDALPRIAARQASSAAASGEHTPRAPYRRALLYVRALRIALDEAETTLSDLSTHSHDYNDNDLCSKCGADGRA